jgi:hypothetical protein
MGFEKPIPIIKAIEGIQTNEYVLPAIQREFVWNADQIESLFDSLMRGYPIGSFLFWEIKPERLVDFQFYQFMDRYHERDYRRNEPINLIGDQQVIAVLDGQQRLTALNIGLRGWYAEKLPYYRWSSNHAFPERRLYLNLLTPPENSEFAYEFQMLREKDVAAQHGNGKFWFPVSDVLNFEDVADAFDYCVDQGLTGTGDKFPHRTLIELYHVIKERPLINFFLEEDQDLDKVLNIFIRVNSGGTQLSYSDMLLSIATAQWTERDARQEIYGLVDQLNDVGEGFSFSKDFVLKACLVLSDTRSIRFRVDSFTRDNMLKIETMWDEISRALMLTALLLSNWGYSYQTLVSNNAVIPLAYYILQKGAPSNFVTSSQFKRDRANMRRWLRVALLKRTFSGQPDNVLRPVRRIIEESHTAFPIETIYDELRPTSKSMDFAEAEIDGLLSYRYGQKYTFTVLALLYPWLKYDQKFHIDHIFPRAMFKRRELERRGIPEDRWHLWLDHRDDLGNLQLLQGIENQIKSDQEFEAWLQGQCETPNSLYAYRQQHMIPDVDLSFEKFPEFLEVREGILRKKLADLFDVSLSGEE